MFFGSFEEGKGFLKKTRCSSRETEIHTKKNKKWSRRMVCGDAVLEKSLL